MIINVNKETFFIIELNEHDINKIQKGKTLREVIRSSDEELGPFRIEIYHSHPEEYDDEE
jgi:hypothetical protein